MIQKSHSNPQRSAAPMLPIIEKLTHVNQLDILSVKYQQAVIETKDENKALQMQKYAEWLHSASKYIIVQYERSEVATRLNMDMIRTVAWQEEKIKQLETEIVKLKKVIEL
jgi:hypothetical protein